MFAMRFWGGNPHKKAVSDRFNEFESANKEYLQSSQEDADLVSTFKKHILSIFDKAPKERISVFSTAKFEMLRYVNRAFRPPGIEFNLPLKNAISEHVDFDSDEALVKFAENIIQALNNGMIQASHRKKEEKTATQPNMQRKDLKITITYTRPTRESEDVGALTSFLQKRGGYNFSEPRRVDSEKLEGMNKTVDKCELDIDCQAKANNLQSIANDFQDFFKVNECKKLEGQVSGKLLVLGVGVSKKGAVVKGKEAIAARLSELLSQYKGDRTAKVKALTDEINMFLRSRSLDNDKEFYPDLARIINKARVDVKISHEGRGIVSPFTSSKLEGILNEYLEELVRDRNLTQYQLDVVKFEREPLYQQPKAVETSKVKQKTVPPSQETRETTSPSPSELPPAPLAFPATTSTSPLPSSREKVLEEENRKLREEISKQRQAAVPPSYSAEAPPRYEEPSAPPAEGVPATPSAPLFEEISKPRAGRK